MFALPHFHEFPPRFRWQVAAAMCVLLVLLAGCAGGSRPFQEGLSLLDEGRYEEGFAQLELAVRKNPGNAEYRIALANRRAVRLRELLVVADAALRMGRLADAEKAYGQALAFEPANLVAKQGLEELLRERRHRQTLAAARALLDKPAEADLGSAWELLRQVLAENPDHPEALNLKARIAELRARSDPTAPTLAAAFRKPISLEFRDAPLKSVFEVIAKVSGLNFLYDKDIRPDLKATIQTRSSSVEDTVRLLLVSNQLEQLVLSDNAILIYPNTPQKQKDFQHLKLRVFYLTNADVKTMANNLKTLVKTRDLVVDERLGAIVMRDTPEAVRMAERIVDLLDQSEPEVMLDVEVLEVKRSKLQELGIQWPKSLSLAPIPSTGTTLTLKNLLDLGPSSTQATVGSLTGNIQDQQSFANLLANPRIRVRNKEKANILIGDRIPVITTTTTSVGTVSDSVSYVDVGLKLEVDPTIYLDKQVAIKVKLEVSNMVNEVQSKNGTLAYQIGTRGATTVLRLKDGETQVLAGLISDEDRRTANNIPGLGDLPVLGRLFGSKKNEDQRSEILLSITPHIVRTQHRPDLAEAEFDSGTESVAGMPALRLGTAAGAATVDVAGPPATAAPGKVMASITPPPTAPIAALSPPASAGPTASSPVKLSWQLPDKIRAGEQFSATLRLTSQGPLRGLPLLVGYDPNLLQVVSVHEGDFFKQAGGQTSFSQRIDPARGKVFVALVRQSTAGLDPGINGSGTLAIVNFKAVKAASTKLQLLSISPEPPLAATIALPVEANIGIVP